MTHDHDRDDDRDIETRLSRYRASAAPPRLRESVVAPRAGFRPSPWIFAAAAGLVAALQLATSTAYRDVADAVELSSLAGRQALVAALAADRGGDTRAYAAAEWALLQADLDMARATDRAGEASR